MVMLTAKMADLLTGNMDIVVFDHLKAVESEYKKFFNVQKSTKKTEYFTAFSGFGVMTEISEGEDIDYEDPTQGADGSVTTSIYAKGYEISELAFLTDQHAIVGKRMANALPKSATDVRERVAFNVFNNAFSTSYLLPDGQPLCDTDHPLYGVSGSVVQANRPSSDADLSLTTLTAGITAFMKLKDPSNIPAVLTLGTLLTAPDEWATAARLLDSPNIPGSANNDINPVYKRVTAVSSPYLTDTDAWFLVAKEVNNGNFLVMYVLKDVTTDHDVDFRNKNMLYDCTQMFSVAKVSYEAIYGSTGAA